MEWKRYKYRWKNINTDNKKYIHRAMLSGGWLRQDPKKIKIKKLQQLSGGVGVVESDSGRDEGPAVPLLLTPGVYQSAAEGAAQGPNSVM